MEEASRARSGSRTPRPLRMLMELARLVLRFVTLLRGEPVRGRRRRTRPYSRVGWSGAWQIESSSASESGRPR